jgi:hypothetical protein
MMLIVLTKDFFYTILKITKTFGERKGPQMRKSITIMMSLLFLSVAFLHGQEKVKLTPELRKLYRELTSAVDEKNIRDTIAYLSSFPSRVTGYPGCDEAAKYVKRKFEEIGLQDVTIEEYTLPIPYDKEASLEIPSLNIKMRIYPLWPNAIRTPSLPPEGVRGPLIYAGDGYLQSFNGKKVEGSVALLNFNCGSHWLNAPRLGVKVVLFEEPDTTMRGEAEAKFISIPIDIARFWVKKQDAETLKKLIAQNPNLEVVVKCSMPWERKTGYNVIGFLPGSDEELRNQLIIIESFFDSISIAPSLAPGAESASGIAAMLELARIFKERPPKRSVLFIATSGHFEALSGIRAYFTKHFKEYEKLGPMEKIKGFFARVFHTGYKPREIKKVYLFTGLDLSSQSRAVGIFYKSMFYEIREDRQRDFSDIARVCRENAERVAEFMKVKPEQIFADGVNPIAGKPWRTFIPGKVALDAELFTMMGGYGVSFFTINDARSLVDTPFDTIDKMNFSNLMTQVKLLACLYHHILNDPPRKGTTTALRFPITEPSKIERLGLMNGFGTLEGRVVYWDPRKSFIPDVPIPDAIVILRHWNKSMMGVRGHMVEMTDKDGKFEFNGVATITAIGWRRPATVNAYKLDEKTGEIVYAPDLGTMGAEAYPVDAMMTVGKKHVTVVTFRCASLSIFDLVDPQGLAILSNISILDGITDGTPRMYGMAISTPEAWMPHVDDCAVIFAEPGSRVKIIMGAGPAAVRFLLLHASMKNPKGDGYEVKGSGTLYFTPYKVAKDMWIWDEYRMSKLRRFRIINDVLEDLHKRAKEELDSADKALATLNYSRFYADSRSAWGYESRAYPVVRSTGDDVVRGVIFYMAIVIPFAFFLERLLFAFPTLIQQLAGLGGIFLATFAIFRYLHPAFEIALNPLVILLAFVMLAMAASVATVVIGRFQQQLRALHRSLTGIHRVDIGRFTIAASALSLGISNMRRRKARTALTCITLIVLTFAVLAFTSVKPVMRFNKVPGKGIPRYQGIMLRTPMWSELQEVAYRVLYDEFSSKGYKVSPRIWFYTSAWDEQSFVTLTSAADPNLTYDVKALVGLGAEEASITRPQEALKAGRWIEPNDKYVCIIPEGVAKKLKISTADVGKAQILIGGVKFTVIGILDNNKFKKIKDLDNEPITPVDFVAMQKQQQQGQTSQQAGFREYIHLEPDAVTIIPYQTLLDMGGTLRSVAIDLVSAEQVKKVLGDLMPRLALNMYAGEGRKIFRYSTLALSAPIGWTELLIIILIAVLIVLDTMLAAVYERVREIRIFASLGLAPNHIAMLFFAEALVYAVIGAIAGYIVGQTIVKIMIATGKLGHLYLNFSSMSAVLATFAVVAVTLLSTIYPARKASEVATPALERSWSLPEPEGDEWHITLPFSVTGEQSRGLAGFLKEWLEAYEEYSVGDFVTADVKAHTFTKYDTKGYQIDFMCWLAPFDLGVSQRVSLIIEPTTIKDVYDIKMVIRRESGDVANWKRVNRRFLNTIRKQFLIWRTISVAERERYVRLSEELVELA